MSGAGETMTIELTESGGGITVKFDDRLTFADHEEFGDILARVEASGSTAIVFEFHNTSYIDSSALGMLLIAKDAVGERGAAITLRGANADLKRLFDLGTFAEFFTIED